MGGQVGGVISSKFNTRSCCFPCIILRGRASLRGCIFQLLLGLIVDQLLRLVGRHFGLSTHKNSFIWANLSLYFCRPTPKWSRFKAREDQIRVTKKGWNESWTWKTCQRHFFLSSFPFLLVVRAALPQARKKHKHVNFENRDDDENANRFLKFKAF